MPIVLGTSSGFVTTAPTADPTGAVDVLIDNASVVTKDTSPGNAVRIIEVGWYRGSGTNTANWEIGLYSDNAGVADVLLAVEATNSSSSTGWLTKAVDWLISANTDYWLAVQMDAHAGDSTIDCASSGGPGRDRKVGETTLTNPYGGGAVLSPSGMCAIYALVETGSAAGKGARATTTIGGAF